MNPATAMKSHRFLWSLPALAALLVGCLSGPLCAATAEYGNITVDTRAILQGNVEVRVMDGTTGALLSGAAVTAAGQSQNTVNGVATFSNLPSATYTFGVVMAGYASVDQLVEVPAGATRVMAIPIFPGTSLDQPQIATAASQVIRDVATGGSQRLMLLTTYKLYGTAPDYSVVLHYRRGNNGNWQAIPPANLIDSGTNAPNWGAAVKPGLHQAMWDVAVDLPNTLEPLLQVQIIATRNGRSAVKETQFLSLDTRSVVTSTLSGRIVQAGGTPVSGATVQLMPHQKSVVTGADGTFSLADLPPATGCNLRVSATGYQPFLKNPLAVPTTALNLGDLTLTPEVRVMKLRPLQPNPNPGTLEVPVGGTGYLYFQVMTQDGTLSCPGQTVQLETTGGILIPQSVTAHENWAGPTAGLSDKDGIVRLEVPASAIGGVAGAIVNVRVRPTATLVPDTANFPAASTFGTTAEVVPREWEQVREMETSVGGAAGISAVAGAKLGLERAREVAQRSYFSGTQYQGESISSGTQAAGKVGVEVSTPEVSIKMQSSGAGAGASAGAHSYVGLLNRNEYEFPAVAGTPSTALRDKSFKLYHCLRDDISDFMPFGMGKAFVFMADSQVLPVYAGQLLDSEAGALVGGGFDVSLDLGFKALPKNQVSLGLNATLSGDTHMQLTWGRGNGGAMRYERDVVAGSASLQAGGGLDLSLFSDILPQAEGAKPPGWLTTRLSAGMEVEGSKGCRFRTSGTGSDGDMVLEEELYYIAPGGIDVGSFLDPGTFPTLPVPTYNQTRRFLTETSVRRANGGAMSNLGELRGVSPWLHGRRKQALSDFSKDSQYRVTYTRRLETGEASAGTQVGFDLNLGFGLEFEASGRNFRSAGGVVEYGSIRSGKEFPLWTSTPPQQSEVPSNTMTSVMSQWALDASSDLTDLASQAATKTVKTVAGKVVNVWKKPSQPSPANIPVPNGGPQPAPAPLTEEGWENYGISGLYELTSDTPITTALPLALSYTTEDLDGGNAADLGAYYFVPETSNWEKLPATLDTTAMTVTVDATRPGYYGLALPQPAGAIPLMLDATPPLAADGVTTANVRASGLVLNNGNPVADGTLYTVTAQGVSLIGTDANSTLDGFQLASTTGTLVIGIRTPAGGADAAVTVESAGAGTAKGTLEFGLRDTTAPAAPASIGITAGTSGLRAAWSRPDAPDLAGYRVYYKQGAAGPPWDGVSAVEGNASPVLTDELFADINGLVPGAAYHLAVSAVDTTGNESALGTVVSATLPSGPPAPPPSATVVKGADGQVFLSWALSPDDLLGQRNVDHYEVRRRLPGGNWTSAGTAVSGQATLGEPWPAGATGNNFPEYQILAVSAGGTSQASATTEFDSDSDTLPDAWEIAAGLNPNNPADATGNADGDLRGNLEEYLAGSFPGVSDGTDFRVTQFVTPTNGAGTRPVPAGTIRLVWNTLASLPEGDGYVVESSQTLEAGSWQTVADALITIVNRTGVAEFSHHPERPREFYRVRTSSQAIAIVGKPTFLVEMITAPAATTGVAYSTSITGFASGGGTEGALVYSKVSGPSWITVSPEGNLSGTPAFADAGTCTVVVRVENGSGSSATATVMIQVVEANLPPSFAGGVLTGAAATEDTPYSGSLADFASDPNSSDILSFSRTSGPAWLAVSANGTLSGTPSNSDVGLNSFEVRVTDAAGASASATLSITVANTNDAPVISAPAVLEALRGVPVASSAGASDMDAGDTLTFSKVAGPSWLLVSSAGAITGTPGVENVGDQTLGLRVTDSGGLFAETTVTVKVASDPLWTNPGSGSWSTATNWRAGIPASGAAYIADFSTLDLTADATVTLDSARTIGGMRFGDTSPSHNWTLNTGTSGPLTLQSTGTPSIEVVNQAATITTVLAGTQGFAKTGGGTLTLAGANTYGGGTTISAGTLNVNNVTALGAAGSPLTFSGISTINNTSTADIILTNNNAQNWNADFTFTGTRSLNLGSGVVTLNANRQVTVGASTLTVGGIIKGTGYGLTKSGAGTLLIGGNSGHTLSGAVTVSGGVLTLGTLVNSGTMSFNTPLLLKVQNTATLDLPTLHALTVRTVTWTLAPLSLENGSILRFRASTGSNAHYLSANISNTGTTSIVNNGGSYDQDIYLSGKLSGAGDIRYVADTAANAGTYTRALTLSNSTTNYTGNWTVDYAVATSDDYISLASTAAGALGTGNVILDDRARLVSATANSLSSLSGVTLQQATSYVDMEFSTTLQTLNGNTGVVAIRSGTGGVVLTLNSGSFAGTIQNGTGNLALTKATSGTLILSGTNTYSGDTTVTGGVLSLGGSAIADTNKLILSGGKVDLPSGVTETVGTLYFGTTQQVIGTWGSSQSAATHKDDTRFSGTGVLVVASGPTGFAAVVSSNSADQDDDQDGVSNGIEYFMGQTGNGFTANPGIVNGSVTWPKSPGFVGTYAVQTTTDLMNWTDVTNDPAQVTTTASSVTWTHPAGAETRFVRLVVTPQQ